MKEHTTRESPNHASQDKSVAYQYSLLQPASQFAIVSRTSCALTNDRAVVLAVEAFDMHMEVDSTAVSNWTKSTTLNRYFQYVPKQDVPGFVSYPLLSFDRPVSGLKLTFHEWGRNVPMLESFITTLMITHSVARSGESQDIPVELNFTGFASRVGGRE